MKDSGPQRWFYISPQKGGVRLEREIGPARQGCSLSEYEFFWDAQKRRRKSKLLHKFFEKLKHHLVSTYQKKRKNTLVLKWATGCLKAEALLKRLRKSPTKWGHDHHCHPHPCSFFGLAIPYLTASVVKQSQCKIFPVNIYISRNYSTSHDTLVYSWNWKYDDDEKHW